MFNGTAYKKLYLYGLERQMDGTYLIQGKQFCGLMRDDITERKVYAILICGDLSLNSCFRNPEEVLLYDFTHQEGDSIRDCRMEGVRPEARYQADSIGIEHLYDMSRNVWYDMYRRRVLIEGVGYGDGLLNDPSGIVHADYATSMVDYCIGTNFACGIFTSTNVASSNVQVPVFPNPTESLLWFASTEPVVQVKIHNTAGQNLIHIRQSSSEPLDVSHLPPGFYILEVFASNRLAVAKFVKR